MKTLSFDVTTLMPGSLPPARKGGGHCRSLASFTHQLIGEEFDFIANTDCLHSQ